MITAPDGLIMSAEQRVNQLPEEAFHKWVELAIGSELIPPFGEPPSICCMWGAKQIVREICLDKTVAFTSLHRRMGGSNMSKISREKVQEWFAAPETVSYYEEAVEEIGLWNSERVFFTKYLPKHGRVLDLGCGAGRTTFGLHRLGYTNLVG